jgi:hypothetical protein
MTELRLLTHEQPFVGRLERFLARGDTVVSVGGTPGQPARHSVQIRRWSVGPYLAIRCGDEDRAGFYFVLDDTDPDHQIRYVFEDRRVVIREKRNGQDFPEIEIVLSKGS